jgi:methionyl aminopeptidase
MAGAIKTSQEIEVMAEVGKRLAIILAELCGTVRPGLPTRELDARAREFIKKSGGTPAFLGHPVPGSTARFPAALCVSINEVVVHGLPSEYTVREGDVVKLDLGVVWKGWYADAARTVIAGEGTPRARRLLRVTEEALAAGIRAAKPGSMLGDVGAAIEACVRRAGFSVVEKLCGHGIGRELHEEPSVPNVGVPGKGVKLVPGMVLAIEPMVAAGSGVVVELPDGSFKVRDGSITAHCEHTVAITLKGPRVLTV